MNAGIRISRGTGPSALSTLFYRAPALFVSLASLISLFAGCARPGKEVARASSVAELNWPAMLPSSLPATGFRLAEVHERAYSTEYTLTNGAQVLKIEAMAGLGAEGARTMLEDGIMGVRALYANALSPYPGDISREVISDRRYLPEIVRTNWHGETRTYILLFANARFGYGATTADAARHRSLIGWFYCGATDVLYKVRCFGPASTKREELEGLFRSLKCR